jgi:hypothetical protein
MPPRPVEEYEIIPLLTFVRGRAMKLGRTLLATAAAVAAATIVFAQAPSPTPTPQAARRPDEPRAGLTAPTSFADDEPGPGQPRGFRFRNIGPAAGGGRISAIASIPGNPNVIYLGSASGGVFKTVDSAGSWKPIFEKYPQLGDGVVEA